MGARILACAAALCATLHIGIALAAEPYPTRPIRLLISFPPGGSSDVVARAMQPHMERRLGQPVVIENRPGGGGVIGVDAVAKAAPDGYVIGLGAAGALAVNVSLREKMPYDPLTDLAPITLLAQVPFILTAPVSLPENSLREVIARAKANPEGLSIGHGGNGTAMHLTAQLLNQMGGVNVTLVPYRGSGPVAQDVVAGHVPLGVVDIPSSISLIEAGRVKALGVSTSRRVASLPDVPTSRRPACRDTSRSAGSAWWRRPARRTRSSPSSTPPSPPGSPIRRHRSRSARSGRSRHPARPRSLPPSSRARSPNGRRWWRSRGPNRSKRRRPPT